MTLLLSSTILEHLPYAAFLIDQSGKIRHVNERARRDLGYAAPAPCGLLFGELDVSLPIGEWEYYHRRVLADQTARPEEHFFLTHGGEVVRMEVEAGRLDSDGGPLVLLLAKRCYRGLQTATGGGDRRSRFLSFLESVPGLVAHFDREQRVDYASRDLERRLELVPGALSGSRLESWHRDWTLPLQQAVESVLRTGEAREVILEALLAAGRVTDTVHVVPIRNPRGEVESALAYAEIAAERLLREATVHSTEEPFREIFQNAPDGLYLLDATEGDRFMVVDVNPAFARFVGRSRGELTGRTLDELMPSEHVKSHTAKFQRCVAVGDRVEEQGRLQAAGGPLWYGSIQLPIRDGEGRVRGIVGIFRDIAAKMHMRGALRESERRYREIAERSTDSIFLLEVTPERRFRALGANPAFEATFGFRREEVIGRLLEEIVPRPLAEFLTARYAAAVEAGAAREEELEVELPNGRHRLKSTLVPMPDSAGEVRRLMVISSEIPAEAAAVRQQRAV
jgi:PAS domain S-box-containing protein